MVESVKPQEAQNSRAQCLLGPGLTRYSNKKKKKKLYNL